MMRVKGTRFAPLRALDAQGMTVCHSIIIPDGSAGKTGVGRENGKGERWTNGTRRKDGKDGRRTD
jgi:hypothetical protein